MKSLPHATPTTYHAAMSDPAPSQSATCQDAPMTVEHAYQHCMHLAREHYENFPTASLLIRRDLRPAVAAIYAFARAADDMADEGTDDADKRLKQLDAWEVLLERCEQASVNHPVFMALGDAIRTYKLPVACLHDLLTAFRMDVSIHAYATVDELMFYCRHSANPVGRLILALHGISHPVALTASDAICTALQLTNLWQDFSRDIPNGRCYLPEEWLKSADLSSTDLLEKDVSDQIQPALSQAVEYTDSLFKKGRELLPFLPFRLKLQIAATLRGGRKVLRKVQQSHAPLHQRPALQKSTWLTLTPLILFDVFFPPYRNTMKSP